VELQVIIWAQVDSSPSVFRHSMTKEYYVTSDTVRNVKPVDSGVQNWSEEQCITMWKRTVIPRLSGL
jgi:hypothetical protein